MQPSSRYVNMLLSGAPQFLLQKTVRGLQRSSHIAAEVDRMPEKSLSAAPIHLQSVFSLQEGSNTFAATSVGFGQVGEASVPDVRSAAQYAVQVALVALRGALGCSRPPSAVVVLPCLDLPQPAVAAAVATLTTQLGPNTALIGCSSRLRVPDERRVATLAVMEVAGGAPPHTATPALTSSSTDGTTVPNGQLDAPRTPGHHAGNLAYHITLAAAHLPYHEVHALHCVTASLPHLPHLVEALQGRRPPAFLTLAAAEGQATELLGRLENLFPGSCIGGGVAAQPNRRYRQLTLVGPGTGPPGGLRGPGPTETAVTANVGQAGRGATDVGLPLEDGVDKYEMHSEGQRATPASEFEGPFHRMLLNRQQTTAISPLPSNPAASAAAPPSVLEALIEPSGSSPIPNPRMPGGPTGRRRLIAPASASRAPASAAPTQPIAAREAIDEDSSAAAAANAGPHGAAEAVPLGRHAQDSTSHASSSTWASSSSIPRPPLLLPEPLLIAGGQVHPGGCALLAIYPRNAGLIEEPAAAGSHAAATTSAEGGRLPVAACDILARVALGTDLLHHVTLRGAALTAISPPSTGPELAAPESLSHDNPFYWLPAKPEVRNLAVHHQNAITPPQVLASYMDSSRAMTSYTANSTPPPATPYPESGSVLGSPAADCPGSAEGRVAEGVHAQFVAAISAGAAAERTVAGTADIGVEADCNGSGDEGEDDEEEGPSAAALAALRGGLKGLPLFPLEGAILFPGQTITLRVFEKRYKLLLRSCIEQGGAFGLCWRGLGCTAVVRSYQSAASGSSDIMVLLEGGVRFSYGVDEVGVQPASYGLNVAKRAEYVLDEPPASKDDEETMLAAAYTIIDSIVSALEAATTPTARQSARTFANALHFASSNQQPHQITALNDAAAIAPSPAASPGPVPSDTEVLAADVAEAKAALNPDSASLLSLYLCPHVPVHLESLRREWFTTRSALWRLQQEVSWLRSNPRVCLAVASSVLRLPREHPLRLLLGLSRVAPVG